MKLKKNAIINWIDERWPIRSFLKWGLKEDIPGGASFAYVLGSTTLFLFIILVLTGIWSAFYYAPTIDHAYDSLMYLYLQVPFGWLIHGLHYWAANAFVISIGLHMLQGFIWGAYKKPRELTWLSGVVLILLTAGFIYTGPFLAWDKQGYWAGKVGMAMIESIPFIGQFLANIMQGGTTLGQLTLSRFFVLHVFILPMLVALFIIIHIVAFRRFGNIGPWKEEKRNIRGNFWPDQIFKNMISVAFVLLVLIGLCAYALVPITGLADPLDATVFPKPAWPFLFFYEFLKIFGGPYEILGVIGVPLVCIIILLLPPFIDRRKDHNPCKRLGILVSFFIFIAAIFFFTFEGYYSRPEQEFLATNVVPPQVKIIPSLSKKEAQVENQFQEGQKLFNTLSCNACHTIDGSGGGLGPDLFRAHLDKVSRDRVITQIKEPKKINPNTVMPSYANLNQEQIDALVYFLQNLTQPQTKTLPLQAQAPETHRAAVPVSKFKNQPGPAAQMIGSAEHGKVIYNHFCASCHNVDGKGGISNPGSTMGTIPPLAKIDPKLFDEDPELFAKNIDPYIQYGSPPVELELKSLRSMPNFGESGALTQEQIADVEAYILYLNGVDRAKIINPGIEPHLFFFITLAIFGVVCVILFISKLKSS